MSKIELTDEELEKMEPEAIELALEEMQNVSGGALKEMTAQHEKTLRYLINKWKKKGDSYEYTKEHIIIGEPEEFIEEILEWVDEIYGVMRVRAIKSPNPRPISVEITPPQ